MESIEYLGRQLPLLGHYDTVVVGGGAAGAAAGLAAAAPAGRLEAPFLTPIGDFRLVRLFCGLYTETYFFVRTTWPSGLAGAAAPVSVVFFTSFVSFFSSIFPAGSSFPAVVCLW